LGVWAHPDDESYLSAGLMQRVAARGGRVVCVTATNGERGTDDPQQWPAARLARLRATELAAALGALGAEPPRLLGLPDGGCQRIDGSLPTAAIAAAISEVRPDAIVTFGPDGMTGHPDHIAVSAWTTAAVRDRRTTATLLYA